MDDKTQKERLEQELRFLKESFEAEVISNEEYEKGKERIERKLKLSEIEGESNQQYIEQLPKKEELQQQKEEAQQQEKIVTEKESEKIKLNVIQDELQEQQEQKIIKTVEQKTEEVKKVEEEKRDSKLFKYGIIFVILIIMVYFSFSLIKKDNEKNFEMPKNAPEQFFFVACSSDNDCQEAGKESYCINPGTKDAKCEFKELKTSIIVLNDKANCFNCNTERVLSILESWFGELNIEELDYNSNRGKELAEKFDARLLPLYILDENITKNTKFKELKQIFITKNDKYVMSDDATGASLYFRRENIPNKLDLIIVNGDEVSIKAEKNLKEFLDVFRDVKFEKHTSIDEIAKELGIKTFPTFLINNRIKFSGVFPAETIKENFCSLNKVLSCEKNLSKNLI